MIAGWDISAAWRAPPRIILLGIELYRQATARAHARVRVPHRAWSPTGTVRAVPLTSNSSSRRMSIAPLHGGLMQDIVVGVDGSRLTRAALQWAAGEAQRSDANVVVVHAVPRTELWSLSAVQVNIDDVLAELREPRRTPGPRRFEKQTCRIPSSLSVATRRRTCCESAKRKRASMLVLGSKSHTALSDLVVGGTVHKGHQPKLDTCRPRSRQTPTTSVAVHVLPGGPNRHRSDRTPPGW